MTLGLCTNWSQCTPLPFFEDKDRTFSINSAIPNKGSAAVRCTDHSKHCEIPESCSHLVVDLNVIFVPSSFVRLEGRYPKGPGPGPCRSASKDCPVQNAHKSCHQLKSPPRTSPSTQAPSSFTPLAISKPIGGNPFTYSFQASSVFICSPSLPLSSSFSTSCARDVATPVGFEFAGTN